MKSAPLQERVEFDLLETAGSPETLLIPGRHIDRLLLAFGFRLSAFENNDVAWHDKLDGGKDWQVSFGPEPQRERPKKPVGSINRQIQSRQFRSRSIQTGRSPAHDNAPTFPVVQVVPDIQW